MLEFLLFVGGFALLFGLAYWYIEVYSVRKHWRQAVEEADAYMDFMHPGWRQRTKRPQIPPRQSPPSSPLGHVPRPRPWPEPPAIQPSFHVQSPDDSFRPAVPQPTALASGGGGDYAGGGASSSWEAGSSACGSDSASSSDSGSCSGGD